MSEATPVPDDLLRHAAFVRRLARSLLGDEHAAEDAVQETWRASLEHPPGRAAEARAWLARVLRNTVRRRWRGEERRAARERQVAREEALPSAESTLEREEILQRVVEAVRALPEPYRATILARFYEGLSPSAIAAREGLALETVNTRLKRGLARLRARLERAPGTWRASLGLLAGEHSCLPSHGVPAVSLLMQAKSLAVALTVIVLSLGAWRLSTGGARSAPTHSAGLSPTEASSGAPLLSLEPEEEEARRSLSSAASQEPRLSGRVLDESGAPVPEARVVVLGRVNPFGDERSPDTTIWDPYAGRSFACDAEGRWSALLVAPMDVIVALQPSETFELEGDPGKDAPDLGRWAHAPATDVDFVVRRLPFATLEVRVLEGATRRPLEGFSIAVHGAQHADGYSTLRTTSGLARLQLGVPDPGGRGVIVELSEPRLGGAKVELGLARPSQPTQEVLLLPGETRELVLVLPERGHVRGFVVDGHGAPVPDALVFFGEETRARGDEPFKPLRPERILDGARTAADGWFELDGDGPRVTVVHTAFSSTTVEVAAAGRIVLASRGAIRGELRAANGAPRAGEVLFLDKPRGGPETSTDAAGRFGFEHVEAGAHALWSADAAAKEPLVCLRLAAGEEAALVLDAPAARTLTLELVPGPLPEPDALRGVLIGRERLFDLRFAFVPGTEPGTLSCAAPRPGRYWLASQLGISAPVELVEGAERVVLELGTAELVVRAASGVSIHSVQVVPADADPFLRLMAARTRVRLDPESCARFQLAPGRYLLVGEAGFVLRELELPRAGLELTLE